MEIEELGQVVDTNESEVIDEDIDLDNLDSESEESDEDIEISLDETADTEKDETSEQTDEEEPEEEEKETEASKLKADYDRLARLSKDALSKLGLDVGDSSAEEILEKAAAEAEGLTLEEYRKQSEEQIALEKAKSLVKQQKVEELLSADLVELKKSFPELLDTKHITKIPNFELFGKLRDAGIPVKAAYLAVNGDAVREKQVAAVKQQAARDSKSHLSSAVSKRASVATVVMPKSVLDDWRSIFPDKSDKEIATMYRESL